jgi:hypothetical protein
MQTQALVLAVFLVYFAAGTRVNRSTIFPFTNCIFQKPKNAKISAISRP